MKADPAVPAGGNRLLWEKSLYLRQHGRQPVDWFPWGEEAWRRARKEDKPVFVSIGYSACHWCHVMARESFADPEIARLLNRNFVSIKVDREERPDLDEVYMLVTQVLTGQGGWPNSVWVTPHGEPWFAGTYFPPMARGGVPGLREVLAALAAAWRTQRSAIERQAHEITQALRRMSNAASPPGELSMEKWVRGALQSLAAEYDARDGGFGSAPKFPPHAELALLISRQATHPHPRQLQMIISTLESMARGGICDQLGGGFHRYTIDPHWRIPHFEKMLYDNALLLRAYAQASCWADASELAAAAHHTCAWVLNEMRAPGGAFYAAVDADSPEGEGRYYLWSAGEIEAVLGRDDAQWLKGAYAVLPEGNFSTPQMEGMNVLHRESSPADLAQRCGMSPGDFARRLEACRTRLLAARAERPHPIVDTHLLTAWNGLMIGALAVAGRVWNKPDYIAAAAQAARFLLGAHSGGTGLLHVLDEKGVGPAAFLEDYAFLAGGLLDLHEATKEESWRVEAAQLASMIIDRFRDRRHGGFYMTADGQEALLIRWREVGDRGIPSGNAAALGVFCRLARLTGTPLYRVMAEDTTRAFAAVLDRQPRTACFLLAALNEHAALFQPGSAPRCSDQGCSPE